MEREPQTTRERAMLLLRATLVPGWLPTSEGQRLVWTFRLAILLGGLLLLSSAVDKPLWSWLQLLIVPAALAIGVAWLNRAQRQRELDVENQRAQDEALLKYLEQMGQLLNTDSRKYSQNSDIGRLARAWTQTTLEMLDDPRRKRSLLRFLYESQLICKDRSVVKLERARLQGVDLEDAILVNADLCGAWMRGADLRGADLRGADLRGADLSYANLSNTDLSDADLSGAEGVTEEQLEQQAKSLDGATMPDGSIHPPLTVEGREEDGKNSGAS